MLKFVLKLIIPLMAIIQTTIYDLRTTVIPNVNDTYYTTDPGQEGNWVLDPLDNLSADNTGIILLGQPYGSNNWDPQFRYKRVFDSYVNAKWFGAKGDAWPGNPYPTDDTAAIQLAINTMQTAIQYPPYSISANNTRAQSHGVLFFPSGYYLTSTINLDMADLSYIDLGRLNIMGAGIKSTFFMAKSDYYPAPEGSVASGILPQNLKPIFHSVNQYVTFSEFAIIGVYLTNGVYGLAGDQIGGPYYEIVDGPYYEFDGIEIYKTTYCNFEKLFFTRLNKCINSIGSLKFNVNQCNFGGDLGEYYLNPIDHSQWICNPLNCSAYGIYFVNYIDEDPLKNITSNQINVFESYFNSCRQWGISYQIGTMLHVTGCAFENNGTILNTEQGPQGSYDTGAINIIGIMVPPEGQVVGYVASQINITNTYFEANNGYDFYYNACTNMIFNFTNCIFTWSGHTGRNYGSVLDLHPSTPYQDPRMKKKIVLLNACQNVIESPYPGVPTFVIDSIELFEIASKMEPIFLVNPQYTDRVSADFFKN